MIAFAVVMSVLGPRSVGGGMMSSRRLGSRLSMVAIMPLVSTVCHGGGVKGRAESCFGPEVHGTIGIFT